MAADTYIVIAHRWYLPDGSVKTGGIDRTIEFLRARGVRVVLLEHPLTTVNVDYELPRESTLSVLDGASSEVLERFSVRPSHGAGRWVSECLSSAGRIARHCETARAVIAADPLCGLVGLRLRQRGVAAKSVLHATDYSDRRFASPLLDAVYRRICRKNVREQDLVLCVSTRMRDRFEALWPGNHLRHFPNAPDFASCPREPAAERTRTDLVLLGVAAQGMRHDLPVELLRALADEFPDIALHVVGAGGGDQALLEGARAQGLESHVHCHGYMPRDAALQRVARCGIGLVFYDGAVTWNAYGDSIKVREYAGCGLPVLCGGLTSTEQEAAEAGAALVAADTASAVAHVRNLLQNEDVYMSMSQAASAWAERNDKHRSLEWLFDWVEGEASA